MQIKKTHNKLCTTPGALQCCILSWVYIRYCSHHNEDRSLYVHLLCKVDYCHKPLWIGYKLPPQAALSGALLSSCDSSHLRHWLRWSILNSWCTHKLQSSW